MKLKSTEEKVLNMFDLTRQRQQRVCSWTLLEQFSIITVGNDPSCGRGFDAAFPSLVFLSLS